MPLLSSIDQYKDYMGISPKPDDFDEFWETQKKIAYDMPKEFSLTQIEYPAKDIYMYNLEFKSTFNTKISGRLFHPKNPKGKIPCVIFFHGYRSNNGSIYSMLPYVYNDIAVLNIDVRGQGGSSDDLADSKGATVYGQIIKGIEDESLEKLFYRNVFIDAMRAISLLSEFDFIDTERIGVTGRSQGGALSVISAAMCDEVKAAVPVYPFLSDFKQVFNRNLCTDAYVEFTDYFRKKDPNHEKEEEFFNKLSYIDIQNFAPKIKAKIMWIMALMDTTCHPLTQFAAYNKIQSEKSLKLYPEYTHEPLLYYDDFTYKFFKENL